MLYDQKILSVSHHLKVTSPSENPPFLQKVWWCKEKEFFGKARNFQLERNRKNR